MGPEGSHRLRRLPAHRGQRRSAGLGALRLREDAATTAGASSSTRGDAEPQDPLRRPHGRDGLAGRARRASREPAPHHRHAGRHRAGVGRAAAPPRPHRAVACTTCATCSRSTSRKAATCGRWSTCCTLLRPRRPRGGRGAARAPLGRRGQPAHPRRVQRADARLARVLHVHVLHRPRRQVPARRAGRERASIRSRARPSSC